MPKRHAVFFLLLLPSILLISAFLTATPLEILNGTCAIATSTSMLLTDYLAVGGLGASLFNAAVLGYLSCAMVLLLKIEINGPFIAAVYTVIGFAFFG